MRNSDLENRFLEFLQLGYLRALDLGIPSFSMEELERRDFEFAGDRSGFCMAESLRPLWHHDGRGGAVAKIYFENGEFQSNGLGIFGSVRLTTLLKAYLRFQRESERASDIELYFDDDFLDGALIFDQGIAMRFSAYANKGARNYYALIVESDFSATDEGGKRGNAISGIRNCFRQFDIQGHGTAPAAGNKALKKLLARIPR